jgi:hypothetical protein
VKAFQETTDWAWPNHIYFLNDSRDKMYGYVRGDGQVEVFTKPYRFHVRGRKFREVLDTWNVTVDETEPVEGRNWTVAGSKGASYTVTENHGLWTCTCAGFKFRNRCRHVEEISSTVS